MKLRIIYFLFIASILAKCADPQSHGEKSQDHQQHETTRDIKLNNGEKWKVNVEMTAPIKEMEMLINDFAKTEHEHYIRLASDLQDQINVLVSSCTMTGKAHDELHKWLLPFMELVTELSEVKDEKEAAMIFEKIKASMSTYNAFFQP